MKEIKKILACIDVSEYSKLVLEAAAELVKDKEGCEIILYSVVNQRDVDHIEDVRNYFAGLGSHGVTTKTYIEKNTASRLEISKELHEKYLSGCKAKVSEQVDVGYPADSIIQTAVKEKCDLIIMANKGKGNIATAVFGSVALRVLRNSPIAVLSVRDEQSFPVKRLHH